jgi:hypothetical protein
MAVTLACTTCPLALVLLACSGGSSGSGGVAPPDCTDLVAPSSCPSPPPSWKGEVQGLVEAYCLQCHGNGGIAQAQANLATYDDVFMNRTRLWEAVYNCSMPNTDASPAPLEYPTLAQRSTIITWADPCNAPDN